MYGSPMMREALMLEETRRQEKLIDEVVEILKDSTVRSEELFRQEEYRIFSLETIEKICIRYRLRFLDAELFKAEIPEEAFAELAVLESRYRTKFRRLRIIAPGEFFELGHIEKDPILLAEIAKDKYLYIHKWGGEFNIWRKVSAFPFRTVQSGIISIALLALVLVSILAGTMAGFNVSAMDFIFSVFHLTLGGIVFTVFIALAFSIYPSKMMWKSKFLDI
jgi:ABC-type multidrug transport system fused ATPase/permease subunit